MSQMDLRYEGHVIHEHYLLDGIYEYVVTEHGDGLVGGRGSHASAIAARAEIDRCAAGRFDGCGLREMPDLEPVAMERGGLASRIADAK